MILRVFSYRSVRSSLLLPDVAPPSGGVFLSAAAPPQRAGRWEFYRLKPALRLPAQQVVDSELEHKRGKNFEHHRDYNTRDQIQSLGDRPSMITVCVDVFAYQIRPRPRTIIPATSSATASGGDASRSTAGRFPLASISEGSSGSAFRLAAYLNGFRSGASSSGIARRSLRTTRLMAGMRCRSQTRKRRFFRKEGIRESSPRHDERRGIVENNLVSLRLLSALSDSAVRLCSAAVMGGPRILAIISGAAKHSR